MNLILIHGNGIVASLNKIASLKKDFANFEIQEFSVKHHSLSEGLMNISSAQLFSQKKLVVLEDFDLTSDLEKLPEDPDLTVVLKFSKLLTVSSVILKQVIAKKGTVFVFSEKDEKSIFPFLDALGEKRKSALKDFGKLYSEYGSQYLLTMLFYLFRRLVVNPKNAPSFVLQKLNSQKRNFDLQKIKLLYKTALETDFKIKSGLIEEKLGLAMILNKILTA